MEYVEVYKTESWGDFGDIKIQINIASSELEEDVNNYQIRLVACDATEKLMEEIKAIIIAKSLNTPAKIKENRDILGIFPEAIYVEEIPNEYCSRACCRHLPWFIVTTKVGRIKIGHRKRVISIDWSDTIVKKTAEELFPDEPVTKSGCLIHAWKLEDAKRYVQIILGNMVE